MDQLTLPLDNVEAAAPLEADERPTYLWLVEPHPTSLREVGEETF